MELYGITSIYRPIGILTIVEVYEICEFFADFSD